MRLAGGWRAIFLRYGSQKAYRDRASELARPNLPSEIVQLAQAKEQIEQTQRRIEEQIDLIDRLRADKHDTRSQSYFSSPC